MSPRVWPALRPPKTSDSSRAVGRRSRPGSASPHSGPPSARWPRQTLWCGPRVRCRFMANSGIVSSLRSKLQRIRKPGLPTLVGAERSAAVRRGENGARVCDPQPCEAVGTRASDRWRYVLRELLRLTEPRSGEVCGARGQKTGGHCWPPENQTQLRRASRFGRAAMQQRHGVPCAPASNAETDGNAPAPGRSCSIVCMRCLKHGRCHASTQAPPS